MKIRLGLALFGLVVLLMGSTASVGAQMGMMASEGVGRGGRRS